MRHAMGWFVVVAAFAGCGKEDEKATVKKVDDKPSPPTTVDPPKDEPPPKPKPPKGQATVDITLTGAVEKTLSGPIGECQIPIISGKPVGATYQVRDGDIELVVLATSEDEIKSPKLIVNVGGANKTSYALKKQATIAKLVPGKSAEVEADLRQIVGRDVVHVKGTFTCNPD